MEFVALHYTGDKDYCDRTPLRNLWAPGDVKLVAERDAKRLLQFAEFDVHEGKTTPEQQERATTAHKIADVQVKKAKQTLENVQVSIDQMDKAALEAYARNYGVELDKRRAVGTLRDEVQALVELHGAV